MEWNVYHFCLLCKYSCKILYDMSIREMFGTVECLRQHKISKYFLTYSIISFSVFLGHAPWHLLLLLFLFSHVPETLHLILCHRILNISDSWSHLINFLVKKRYKLKYKLIRMLLEHFTFKQILIFSNSIVMEYQRIPKWLSLFIHLHWSNRNISVFNDNFLWKLSHYDCTIN